MFGKKAATIKLLEREINEMRESIHQEVIRSNNFFELVNKAYVRNFFYGDKHLDGQPQWVKKEDAVKFRKFVRLHSHEEIWHPSSVETFYTTKEAAKFYRSAIVEWNKQATIEDRKQKKAIAEAKKKLKNCVEAPTGGRLHGIFPVMTSPLMPKGMMLFVNTEDKEKIVGNFTA